MGTGDGTVLGVVGPWGDLKEATVGTGIESLARGFVELRETILAEEDDAIAAVHGLTEDFFLARGNGGANEHPTPLATGKPLLAKAVVVGVGITTMDDDRRLVGDAQKGAVAHSLAGTAGELEVADAETVGIEPFHRQSPGIVGDVVEHPLQLAFSG